MDMLTVFPNIDTALDITEKLIAWGVKPDHISVIGKLEQDCEHFMELVDDITALTLPDGEVLMVAGSLAGYAGLTPTHRLQGLFVDYGLPVDERERLVQQIQKGNYLIVVDNEASLEEEMSGVGVSTMWACPVPI